MGYDDLARALVNGEVDLQEVLDEGIGRALFKAGKSALRSKAARGAMAVGGALALGAAGEYGGALARRHIKKSRLDKPKRRR
jgi:hypothetical protein